MENNATISQPDLVVQTETAPADKSTSAVRVWLVDDNEQLSTLVADLLNRYGGIECVRYFSSPDALLSTLASKPGPDVILLDVQMGDRNGLDAVRPIKSLTRSTRVFMFTTCNNRAWRERALCDGASDYLLKSEAMERVAARIRAPVEDPATGKMLRHRSSCPPPRPQEMPPQIRQASPLTVRTPRFLSRTLKMLHLLPN